MNILIHTGHASVDNGAHYPLARFSELAAAVGVDPTWGQFYGDDRLTVPDHELQVVEQLLIEQNLLYKVVGRDAQWQNVRNPDVLRQLKFLPN